jgi:hypothetical protein
MIDVNSDFRRVRWGLRHIPTSELNIKYRSALKTITADSR